MLSLLNALHVHAAKRGDGLLPKLLTVSPWPHEQPMNENSAAGRGVHGKNGPTKRSGLVGSRPTKRRDRAALAPSDINVTAR